MTYLLLACGAVMLASLSGKLIAWRGLGTFVEGRLHYMVSFAAGVFAIFAVLLVSEVVEHMGGLQALLYIALGAVGVGLVCALLPLRHHHHRDGRHRHLDAHRLLLSDSLHNMGDGIVLAAGFALGPAAGIPAAVGVLVHEAVQEIAEFFVLRDAGYSSRKALLYNFLTSSTILVGALGGWWLLGLFEALEAPLLGLAAGGVLSVVLYDLVPHSLSDARTSARLVPHLVWFVVGAIVMYTVVTLVPHAPH